MFIVFFSIYKTFFQLSELHMWCSGTNNSLRGLSVSLRCCHANYFCSVFSHWTNEHREKFAYLLQVPLSPHIQSHNPIFDWFLFVHHRCFRIVLESIYTPSDRSLLFTLPCWVSHWLKTFRITATHLFNIYISIINKSEINTCSPCQHMLSGCLWLILKEGIFFFMKSEKQIWPDTLVSYWDLTWIGVIVFSHSYRLISIVSSWIQVNENRIGILATIKLPSS